MLLTFRCPGSDYLKYLSDRALSNRKNLTLPISQGDKKTSVERARKK